MGKASKSKRERRARTAAVDILRRALQKDDWPAVAVAVDTVERLVGGSVFDIDFEIGGEATADAKSILDVAASFEAIECLVKLLHAAASRNAHNWHRWTALMNRDYDRLSPNDPRWLFFDRLLRRFFEPDDDQDAHQLAQWASEIGHRPRFSAMVLDVAGAFSATQEQGVIAASIPTPPPSPQSRAAASRL